MNFKEWQNCLNPMPMLDFLRGKVSTRKLRLFAVACCRHNLSEFPEVARHAVEIAERYVDRLATRSEMMLAKGMVLEHFYNNERHSSAITCGIYVTEWSSWIAAEGVARCASMISKPPEYYRLMECKRKSRRLEKASVLACQKSRKSEFSTQTDFLRDIVNPFWKSARPRCLTETVYTIAQRIYDENAFYLMPVLADALEDSAYNDSYVVNHCRNIRTHVRGCHIVDLILNRR